MNNLQKLFFFANGKQVNLQKGKAEKKEKRNSVKLSYFIVEAKVKIQSNSIILANNFI